MIEASVELLKDLKALVDMSESLGELEGAKVCDINEDARVQASIKFLKAYELCVRIDEILRYVVIHKEPEEIKTALDRSKVVLNGLSEHIRSFDVRERRILLAYMQPEFKSYENQLSNILKRTRPSQRIWEAEKLISIATDLSHAIEGLRKSIARALLVVSTSTAGDTSRYFGDIIC
ncbi:MAG: hypothetical protein JXB14_00935 [Candidatus Altiarchaeota archaeon]|nr:hypothetical protein [Candidatus Altiarchaeota archaeon]